MSILLGIESYISIYYSTELTLCTTTTTTTTTTLLLLITILYLINAGNLYYVFSNILQ